MSGISLTDFGLDRPESGDDVAVPFTLETLACRGRSVRLGTALDAILARHDYPAPVARVLGEAIVLAALVGTSLKFDGRFILQAQTDGPVNLIVVDLKTPDSLRAYARFDHDALVAAAERGETTAARVLGKGHLAMTVDQGNQMDRYQGIVALDGEGLEAAAHAYFTQSEQTPTRVRLAVAELSRKGDPRAHWRAGGTLVQFLPEGEATPVADLSGGDPEADPAPDADPRWEIVDGLMQTLGDDELADPDVSAERLLFRLFHEHGLRVFQAAPLKDQCSCSADTIENMLTESFSAEQRRDMVVDGQIEVVCEFCSTAYQFNPHQFDPQD